VLRRLLCSVAIRRAKAAQLEAERAHPCLRLLSEPAHMPRRPWSYRSSLALGLLYRFSSLRSPLVAVLVLHLAVAVVNFAVKVAALLGSSASIVEPSSVSSLT